MKWDSQNVRLYFFTTPAVQRNGGLSDDRFTRSFPLFRNLVDVMIEFATQTFEPFLSIFRRGSNNPGLYRSASAVELTSKSTNVLNILSLLICGYYRTETTKMSSKLRVR